MDHNRTVTTIALWNATRCQFYWPQVLEIIWDEHVSTSPLIFNLTHCRSFEEKERRELQKLSNILLSSMTIIETLVGGICVPLSATHGLSLPYQILTPQHIFTLHVATGFLRDNFSGECTKSKNCGSQKLEKISIIILRLEIPYSESLKVE